MEVPAWLLGVFGVLALAGTFLTMFSKHPNVPESRRRSFDALGDALVGLGVAASLWAFSYRSGYGTNPVDRAVFWIVIGIAATALLGLLIYVRRPAGPQAPKSDQDTKPHETLGDERKKLQ